LAKASSFAGLPEAVRLLAVSFFTAKNARPVNVLAVCVRKSNKNIFARWPFFFLVVRVPYVWGYYGRANSDKVPSPNFLVCPVAVAFIWVRKNQPCQPF